MKTIFKTTILALVLILFSSILIGANNSSNQEIFPESNENVKPETFLLNLDEVVKENKNQNSTNHTLTKETKNEDEGAPSPSSTSKEEEKTIPLTLYSEGKKEIEGKIPESFNSEIKKTEKEIDKNKKEVIIKSSEHLESPLTVYTNIKETKNKEEIEVYWVNKKTPVKIEQYLDTNDNGLIDRIAWIVPHLSEQIFEVIISETLHEESNTLEIVFAEVTENLGKLNLELEINYSFLEDITCTFSIKYENGSTITAQINEGPSIANNFNLENGNYEWEIYCEDDIDPLIKDSFTGEITIDKEEFQISNLDNYYLLEEEINFASNYPLASFIQIINPQNTPIQSSLVNCGDFSCTTGGVAV